MTTSIEIEPNPIQVAMVADSISDGGIRISTLHLRYPRFIHSELMTHRVFSRNARSSRAVPVEKLLQEPIYMPHFMQNQSGMQSFEELDPEKRRYAESEWEELARLTRIFVSRLGEAGVHKQWANRPLEWFGFIDVLVTSTDWSNWDALRNHKDAMPEIRELARRIEAERLDSIPIRRSFYSDINGWHLPYITEDERYAMRADDLCKISAARCARISYKPFDADEPNAEADLKLFDKLMGAQPLHASPAEHQAIPDMQTEWSDGRGNRILTWMQADQHGNFYGWRQFRKTLKGECVRDEHYDF